MTKEGKFMIFCAEQYKYAKKLTGRQLDELFSKYRVWDYLYACYEAKGSLSAPLITVPFTCISCAYTEAKVKLSKNKTDNNFFICLLYTSRCV